MVVAIVATVCTSIILANKLFAGAGDNPQEAPRIDVNTYEMDAFYQDDGFLRYDAAEHMVGIDVSAHQEEIDWQAVSAAGVEFAIIRAGFRGYAEGSLNEDDYFRANMEGARAAGLKIGVYFFSQARNVQEAREEAEFVCELLADYAPDLPIFFDWELVEDSARITSEEGIPLTQCAIEFCETVKAAGYDAGVYFNQSYGYMYFDLEPLQPYTLWLAQYNPKPNFYYNFDLVQYSDAGSVDGIPGKVDLNLWILLD
ncbi:MAG: glycoside hydrolase family 25 protein [Oscillospiraceae bacterium]|jgi:GH25 family lysozyme M1 (1,4-beta-N-acetylmuramidase)|nr:glycoside hydrolase family 25 protein [Oscillospiraceae bacterium]